MMNFFFPILFVGNPKNENDEKLELMVKVNITFIIIISDILKK